MGSRKLPTEFIILPMVVGILIESISFIFSGTGFISDLWIFVCLGMKKNNINIDNSSLITLKRINPVIALVIPNFNRWGVIYMIITSLIICSKNNDTT